MNEIPIARGRRRLSELALLALITALGAVVWIGGRQMSPAQGNQTPGAPPGSVTPQPINDLSGWLVYPMREDSDPMPVLVADLATGQQVAELSPWQFTGPAPDDWALSPDGRWLALDNGAMEVRDVGTQATLKASMPAEAGSFRVEGIHWAPNGRAVYYGIRKDLPEPIAQRPGYPAPENAAPVENKLAGFSIWQATGIPEAGTQPGAELSTTRRLALTGYQFKSHPSRLVGVYEPKGYAVIVTGYGGGHCCSENVVVFDLGTGRQVKSFSLDQTKAIKVDSYVKTFDYFEGPHVTAASPDGRWVAFTQVMHGDPFRPEVDLLDLETLEVQTLTKLEHEGSGLVRFLWSPDSQGLAWTELASPAESIGVSAWRLTGGQWSRLLIPDGAANDSVFAFSPGSGALLFADRIFNFIEGRSMPLPGTLSVLLKALPMREVAWVPGPPGPLSTVVPVDFSQSTSPTSVPTETQPTAEPTNSPMPTVVDASPTSTPVDPSPTPTSTPIARGTLRPVVMTIADAEREVLSWFLPANEARIERSLAVMVADLLASRPAGAPALHFMGMIMFVDDNGRFGPGFDKMKELAPDQVVIVVEGSHKHIALDYAGRDAGEPPAAVPTDPELARSRYVSYFAAATGEHLGDQPLDSYHPEFYRDWLDTLVRRPTAETVLVASATPTASKTATPTPLESATPNTGSEPGMPTDAAEARPLTAGQVPAALVDAARELAEVPGSRWVYRVTENWFGPHWSQHTVTETIRAAWRIAPDAMMVERGYQASAIEAGKTARNSPKDPWRSGCNDANPYFLFPNGSIGVSHSARSGPTLARMRQLLDHPSAEGGADPCDIVMQLRLPLVPSTVFSAGAGRTWWQTKGRATLDVPAGRFDGCIALLGYLDDRQGATHWTCPRVGVVRHELPGYTFAGGGFALYELIDYYIPPIVPTR